MKKIYRARVFFACIAFGCLALMGCNGGGDGPAPAPISISGTFGLFETSGEGKELNVSSVKIEQTGNSAIVRDSQTMDEIAKAQITPDGYVSFVWGHQGAGTWLGKINGGPVAGSITGVVDSASPLGLKSWSLLRTTSVSASSCDGFGPSNGGNSGRQRICNAGTLPYDPAPGPAVATGDASTYPGDGDPGQVIQCKSQPFTQTTVATATLGTVMTPDESVVYAGSILQGSGLPAGNLIANPIARSGGHLSLVGPTLAAQDNYAIDVDEVTPDKVRGAVNDLLHRVKITVTPDNYVLNVQQASSANEMALKFGMSLRSEFSAKLNATLTKTTTKNHYVAQYTQVFYGIEYALPKDATTGNAAFENVFVNGANFVDVSPPSVVVGNPVLYVQEVKYGRQIYFAVESTSTVDDINVALRGAMKGGKANISVDQNNTLTNSSITVWVSGGSTAFANIDPANPADALYALIKDGSVFSVDSNPGVPMQMTMKYLLNDIPVATNMSTNFTAISCAVVPVIPTWKLLYQKVNHELVVLNDQTKVLDVSSKSGDSINGLYDFTPPLGANGQMDDKDHYLNLTLSNSDCFSSNADLYIQKSGQQVASLNYHHGTSTCGNQLVVTFGYTNKAKGELTVQNCTAYHGSSWQDCKKDVTLTP